MFQVLNKTPFQAGVGLIFDPFGANMAAAAVKATFTIPDNHQPAELADEQLAPLLHDDCFDTPSNSGIRYSADIVLGKRGTDVAVNGSVYSKDERPVERVTASVRVGTCHKRIEAVGDRYWKKRRLVPGLYITRPESFVRMPITCDRLYGGRDRDKNGEPVSWEPNPHGTGFAVMGKSLENTRLPNFEHPGKRISSWRDRPAPATFGFAAPSAQHRIKHAGTYDDNWIKNHAPLYPEDLDLRFFNSAQPELVADGFLKGGETVRLENLSRRGTQAFTLPVCSLRFMFRLGEERIYRTPDLYTIVIEPDMERFYMVWGCSIEIGNQPSQMRYVKTEILESEGACHGK